MANEVLELLVSTPSISLGAVTVVGSYRRHGEQVRNNLKVWRDKIIAPFVRPTEYRENFLVWAPSGTGKTFFITEVAGSWPDAKLTTINLAMDSNEVSKHVYRAFLTGRIRASVWWMRSMEFRTLTGNTRWCFPIWT
jgi:hypothetical protein